MEMAASKFAVASANIITKPIRCCMSLRSRAEAAFLATRLGRATNPASNPAGDPSKKNEFYGSGQSRGASDFTGAIEIEETIQVMFTAGPPLTAPATRASGGSF